MAEEIIVEEGGIEEVKDTPLKSKIELLKDIIQDCNVSFLIGSGLSSPYFGTLGKIENWLSELDENTDIGDELKNFIKASLYKSYFDIAMKDNIEVLNFNTEKDEYVAIKTKEDKLNNTYKAYKDFLTIINHILYLRRSNTVNKQVNLFTTNVDIFLEKVIEDLDYQFNDGFNGIFKQRFSLSNFKKSFYQKSLQYDNISEIPVFNILKIHGSVTWKLNKGNIVFTHLSVVKNIIKKSEEFELLDIASLNAAKWKRKKDNLTIDEIIEEAEKVALIEIPDVSEFISEYEKLQVVNPTKEKFRDTTFNKNYYEILRLYANELEKENSVLFVMGFSMADEHIRDITFRAIKSNPTLKVFICSYSQDAEDIIANLKKDERYINNMPNVELLNPEDGFNLKMVNEYLFAPLLDSITFKAKTKF